VTLILINNNINHIHPRVFRNVTHIVKLQISNEQALDVATVMDVSDNMNKHPLKGLYFTYNGWESIPNDMFKSFEDSNIRRIHLGGNTLQFINGSIFSTLSKFKYMYVNLRRNLINKISMNGLQTVRELNLTQNKIVLIPEWCDHVSNSYVPNLKTLHLNSNYISLLSTFKCLPSLSFLSLQNNSIEEIPEEAFSNLFSLKELNLQSAGNRIKRIERNAFNLSSLETLTIGDCFYHFDQLDSSALLQFFALVSNLQILNMENNPLPRDTHSMSLLFKPISKIRKHSFRLV
jgi:Leucine-rich repeat (LRR) protein